MKTTQDSQGLARDQPPLRRSTWAQLCSCEFLTWNLNQLLISSFKWLEALLRFLWGSNTNFINGLLNNKSRSSLSWHFNLLRKHKSVHFHPRQEDLPTHGWVDRWPRGRLQCTRVRVLMKIHSANLRRAAAELEFLLRSRLTITFSKGNPKEKWRTRVKRTNEQALILSRRTRVGHSSRERRVPTCATR